MEFGDIIYFLLLVFFMILGFFNDSRKKKQQQKQQSEAEPRPFFDEKQEAIPPQPKGRVRKAMPPPVAAAYSGAEVHKEFRSSLDLVSIRDEQSSHPGYTFDYDANSFYEKDTDSSDTPDNVREESLKRALHPLIKNLRDDAGREELKKALIYGEIMQRKY